MKGAPKGFFLVNKENQLAQLPLVGWQKKFTVKVPSYGTSISPNFIEFRDITHSAPGLVFSDNDS